MHEKREFYLLYSAPLWSTNDSTANPKSSLYLPGKHAKHPMVALCAPVTVPYIPRVQAAQ